MPLWKKRRFDDFDIDYESVEGMLAEVLDGIGVRQVDFTKPVKVGFEVALDDEGFLRVNEFGIIPEAEGHRKSDEPLVDVIEMENELMVVIETNNLPAQDIDVKVMDSAMVISSERAKKFMKKIQFPCRVKHNAVRTSYNNNVLELRLPKREGKKAESRQTVAKERSK